MRKCSWEFRPYADRDCSGTRYGTRERFPNGRLTSLHPSLSVSSPQTSSGGNPPTWLDFSFLWSTFVSTAPLTYSVSLVRTGGHDWHGHRWVYNFFRATHLAWDWFRGAHTSPSLPLSLSLGLSPRHTHSRSARSRACVCVCQCISFLVAGLIGGLAWLGLVTLPVQSKISSFYKEGRYAGKV